MAKRKFEMSNAFKRDLKKYYLELVGDAWSDVSNCLLHARPIPEQYKDHPLTGNWHGFRDCHIKPDLVLIYEFVGEHDLILHRLGSHSELSIA